MSALLPLLLSLLASVSSQALAPAQVSEFLVTETLSLPTASGAELLLVPAETVELQVEYGPAGTRQRTRIGPRWAPGGQAARFSLGGLAPSTEVAYRVLVRPVGVGATRWQARPEQTFSTLRREDELVTFAFGPDSHLYQLWIDSVFSAKPKPLNLFKATLDNMADDEGLDFLVLGGDHATTHCADCVGGTVDGQVYAPDSAVTFDQARLRYLKLLEPDHLGRVTGSLPFVWVLGNHEGETAPSVGNCVHSDQLSKASRGARRALLPSPPAIYDSNEEASYYALRSGDALVVVLDVMRFNPLLPKFADEWTLGEEQLTWLAETLQQSDARWRFIAAEHLLGGIKGNILHCYHYGRGGLRATDDGTPRGTFKGEQALLQELMELSTPEGGASFFMTGHDHVALPPTEKFDQAGVGSRVFYLKGGTIGRAPGSWKFDDKFQNQMDWNEDGEADYWNDIDGSVRRGYWRISVLGKQAVQFDYVVTDLDDPLINGSLLLSRTISAP